MSKSTNDGLQLSDGKVVGLNKFKTCSVHIVLLVQPFLICFSFYRVILTRSK